MFVKSVQSSVHEVVKLDEPLGGVSSPAYRDSLRKKIVLGTYFDLLQATEPMLERLTADSARTAEEIEFDAGFRTVVASLLRPEDATLAYERQSLATAQWGQFEQSLGWFGKLLRFKAGSLTPEDTTKFEEENHTRFGKFLSGLTTFATILSVGVIGFLIYSFRFFTGRSRFALDPPSMSPNFCLEIFCLYLLAMLGLSFVFRLAAGMRTEIVERLGGPGMLMLNCIGILSTVLIVFWPRLWGVSVRSTFSTIGLTFGGVGRFFGNLVIGPTFYISAWIPLLAVLIVYSIIIQWFGIDMSKGAHPVIPILLSSEDKEARFFIIFLAVVVAPFVEEIMFRGAFYSWLRSRMGRLSSMLVCSIVFASIHPQGLLGLVPLTCVSMVLCMLREWRQSLVAPMLAHACFNAGTLSMVFLMFGD
ncbi:MAG: CPBP family intramembrane metalloprotease [Deltaproteobacteria bacterium]|nr:CPBP family intramembrane metalloprotease [Deltaproteobacteria bacterium]